MKTPILLDFPDRFETERLVIRSPLPGDGAVVHEAVMETLDELRPWMSWALNPASADQYEELVRRGRLRFLAREDLWLLLFHRETGLFVGGSGLHRIDWDVPKFEIGYWCRKRFQGQGYITEAAKGITRFALDTLGANRVEIRCDSRNARSRAVAERAGYKLEGVLHNNDRQTDGSLVDTLVFTVTRANA